MSGQSRLTSFFPTRKKGTGAPSSKRLKLSGPEETLSLATHSDELHLDCKSADACPKDKTEKRYLETPQTKDSDSDVEEDAVSVRKRKEPLPEPPDSTQPASLPQSTEPPSAKRRLKFSRQTRQDFDNSVQPDFGATFNLMPVVLPKRTKAGQDTSRMHDSSLLPGLPSPSKLNPKDVKKKLGGVKNLQELRSKLASFSDVATKLNLQSKQREADLLVHAKKELDTLSPSKNSTPLLPSTPQKEMRAHERYQGLVSKLDSELEFPGHYKSLVDIFRSTETLVSMMSGRDELITLDKLKSSVQEMTKKNFDRKQLGQIKTVYPEAYSCRLVKLKEKFGQRSRQERFHLVISPNLETDLVNYNKKTPQKTPEKTPPQFAIHISPRKVVQEISPRKTPEKFLKERKKLTIARQLVRREIFRSGLLNILKGHHRDFLKCQDPPVELTGEEEAGIRRWDPRFQARMEKLPEVQPSDLPQEPSQLKVTSAKDLLSQTRLALPESTKRALEKSVEAENSGHAEKLDSKPKGISLSLLQKIRAKQAINNKLAQLSSPSETGRKLKLSRLPDIVRILRNMFLTERKNSLKVSDVLMKLADSYGQLSRKELDSHLELLLEIVPHWITRAEISGKGAYLKIKKETKVGDLLAVIGKAK